jgi:signal transduction histidine kinase
MPAQLKACGQGSKVSSDSAEAELLQLFEQTPLAGALQAAYERLRRSHQAALTQQRMSATAEMASGLAHDLNNSLTPIVGFSDFLMESAAVSDDTRTCLLRIRTAAGDISQLIEQMRQFYRKRDRFEPIESVDVNETVREAVENCRAQQEACRRRGAVPRIQMRLQENLPSIAENERDLGQAIQHLLSNAFDAMPEGGTLTVTTHAVGSTSRNGTPATPGYVVLEVRDTGMGMDAATRRQCLEPFFSTKERRGSGLGLAIVYGLMHRHQGVIEIDSEPDQGTLVRLIFNAAPASSQLERVTHTTGADQLRPVCA